MDDQRPEPEHGPSPSTGARIEEDIVRPLKRIVGSDARTDAHADADANTNPNAHPLS
jgi:hypothetical protein